VAQRAIRDRQVHRHRHRHRHRVDLGAVAHDEHVEVATGGARVAADPHRVRPLEYVERMTVRVIAAVRIGVTPDSLERAEHVQVLGAGRPQQRDRDLL
jgi:hypothetical protein